MQYLAKVERKILYAAAVLLCLVLVSVWMMCGVYARYTATASGGDSARVALFGHSQSITLSDAEEMLKMVPGSSTKYTVTVANYDGSKVGEVALKYNLEIVTEGNLPLVYTINQQNSGSSKTTEIGSFTESSQEKTKVFSTESMCFEEGQKKENTYTIDVQWPEGMKNSKYAGIPEAITVNINIEQVD